MVSWDLLEEDLVAQLVLLWVFGANMDILVDLVLLWVFGTTWASLDRLDLLWGIETTDFQEPYY